jgi:hypothetical protein
MRVVHTQRTKKETSPPADFQMKKISNQVEQAINKDTDCPSSYHRHRTGRPCSCSSSGLFGRVGESIYSSDMRFSIQYARLGISKTLPTSFSKSNISASFDRIDISLGALDAEYSGLEDGLLGF